MSYNVSENGNATGFHIWEEAASAGWVGTPSVPIADANAAAATVDPLYIGRLNGKKKNYCFENVAVLQNLLVIVNKINSCSPWLQSFVCRQYSGWIHYLRSEDSIWSM